MRSPRMCIRSPSSARSSVLARFTPLVLILATGALGCAAETEIQEAAEATGEAMSEAAADVVGPGIEGTYKLVSRELPDGTMLTSPDVDGLITYTGQYRNFNVMWRDAEGSYYTYSMMAEYELTDTEYSETILFSVVNDEIGGEGVQYVTDMPSASSPVTIENGSITFDLPFDPVVVTFAGSKLTATGEEFVDHWEKVD